MNARSRPLQGAASDLAGGRINTQVTSEQATSALAVRDGWKARRSAAARLPALLCGHADPWACRYHRSKPTTDPDLLAAVALHLMGTTGGPGMGHDADAARALWRRGGPAARLAEQINSLGGAA